MVGYSQWNSTGYLQLLATATKNLLVNGIKTPVTAEEAPFSVVYMPMNTNEYKANYIALFLVPTLFAYIFSLTGQFTGQMFAVSGEPGEGEVKV
jgi:hypothetical protein